MIFSDNNADFPFLDDTFNDYNSIGIPFSTKENLFFDLFCPTSLYENSISNCPNNIPNSNHKKENIPSIDYDNIKKLNIIQNKKILKNEEEIKNKVDNLPTHYTFDKIKDIIQKLDISSEIKEKLKV